MKIERRPGDAIDRADLASWCRSRVDASLRAVAARLPVQVRTIIDHHFGWSDGAPGGKAVRPTLAVASALAVGGQPDSGVRAGVAVELVHNFSLIHDDVMDGDDMRRHRPTVWRLFGVNSAILAGNALLSLAFDLAAEDGKYAVRELDAGVQQLLHGQLADLSFEVRSTVSSEEYERMAAAKTGALLGASCALGALVSGGSAKQVVALRNFGERIGTAFQLVDDLLGIWGEQNATGKPVRSDLRNRKKSAPVLRALNSEGAAARALRQLYEADQPLSEADLERAADLVELAGARHATQARVRTLYSEAVDYLAQASFDPTATQELVGIARRMTDRDR